MKIDRVDVIWNYAATFLKIAASSLLLPFILKLPSETVGIWSVFVTVNALILLFDFGFNPTFTRNITYILSGIQKLNVQGFSSINVKGNYQVDYGLLKGVINAMRWFYLRASVLFFLLLSTLGTYYIHILIKNYQGSHSEVYIAWLLLCCINTYNLSTLYYDSLLQGKGLVRRSKQIVIISQIIYLIIAVILIIAGKGLIAIVVAQGFSVIIVRWLSYRLFFTTELKSLIHNVQASSKFEILKAIYPNAVKIGLTTLGTVVLQRSAIVIGSLYLTLPEIASYGVTMQILTMVAGLASIYTNTYQAKIVQMRLKSDNENIKKIFVKGQYIFIITYLFTGLGLLLLGNWLLSIIGSETKLLTTSMLLVALFLSFEQTNFITAGNMLLTKNEVPFFKASLISGVTIILSLVIAFQFFDPGILGMLIIPIIIDFTYQAWKWPLEIIKDLKLGVTDFIKTGK